MDDIDAFLDDVLADDGDYKPKNTRKSPASGGRRGQAKPVEKDDSFYSSLAAAASKNEDAMSDVSDADPNDMAALLGDLDDLDASILGGAKKKTPAAVTTKPATKTADPVTPEPVSRPSTGLDDNSSPSSSRRLEIQRPPTRSGRAKKDDIMFDDDDGLGDLGFGDSPPVTRAKVTTSKSEGDSSDFMSSLFGSSEPKTKSAAGERSKEFVLDPKYTKGSSGGASRPKAEPRELKEEDFQFGGYMPTAAATPSSRPTSSRRSVRFEEDDFFAPPPARSSVSAGGRRKGTTSMMEDMVNKDSRDWLELAADKPVEDTPDVNANRPRTTGSINERKKSVDQNPKLSSSSAAASDPLDWLGAIQKSNDADEDFSTPAGRRGGRARKTESKVDVDDDWLGLGSSEKKPTDKSSAPAADNKVVSKLGSSERPTTSNSVDDADDWLGLSGGKKTTPTKQDDDDDWLGLGKAKRKENIASKADTAKPKAATVDDDDDDWLGLSQAKKKSSSVPQKPVTTEEVFSAPPSRKESSSLPWENSKVKKQAEPLQSSTGFTEQVSTPQLTRPNTFESASPVKNVNNQVNIATDSYSTMISTPDTSTVDHQKAILEQQRQQHDQQMQQQQLKQQQQQQQSLAAQQMQAKMHENFLAQQEALRKQQEEQMQQIQSSSSMLLPTMPQGTMGDHFFVIQQLKMDKEHLEKILECTKDQHKQQMQLLTEANQKKVELLVETSTQREDRLKEENILLVAQNAAHMKQVDTERANFLSLQAKWNQELDKNIHTELERYRETHRQEILDLHNEHELAVNRIKKAYQDEISTISESQAHAKSMHTVLEQVSHNTKELGDLHHKLEDQHSTTLNDRENAANTRDHQLKLLQERLERQHQNNEEERARLQGLINQLENQLTNQTREIEESKWQNRQESIRLDTMKIALEQERNGLLEQVNREKVVVQQAKDKFLEEQQTSMKELAAERRSIAEERAQYNITIKLKQEQQQRENMKYVQNEAEVEGSMKAITLERERLHQTAIQLQLDKDKMIQERGLLDSRISEMQHEKQRVQMAAEQNRGKTAEIERMCNDSVEIRLQGEQAMRDAKQIQNQHSQRLETIHNNLKTLRAKEKQIAEERIAIARDRHQLSEQRNGALCPGCRMNTNQPMAAQLHAPFSISGITANHSSPANGLGISSNAYSLFTTLNPALKRAALPAPPTALDTLTASIEGERMARIMKISAEKDKSFLQEERFFLQSLN